MPNSANRSNGNSNAGKGQPKDRKENTFAPPANAERSDRRQGGHEKDHRGETSRSSSQGRKEASGGTIEE